MRKCDRELLPENQRWIRNVIKRNVIGLLLRMVCGMDHTDFRTRKPICLARWIGVECEIKGHSRDDLVVTRFGQINN